MPTSEKRAAADARDLAVLARAELVERDADGKPSGLTPAGLELVERLAKGGSTQNHIASKLGTTQGAFKKLLGRTDDDSQPRLAWERGRAEHEQSIVAKLLVHGQKNVIALIFYAKAKLHWRENDPAAATIESNIKLVLPQPLSTEEYYRVLGITQPALANNIANKTKTIEHQPAAQPATESAPLYVTQPRSNER